MLARPIIAAESAILLFGLVTQKFLNHSPYATLVWCLTNTWLCHIILLSSQNLLIGTLENIYRIRRFIDTDACSHIVRSIVLSKLDYCNILLNCITKKDLNRLQKLQNKCIRLIFQQPRSTHITFFRDKLHWLPIEKRIIFKTLCFVYKALHGFSPNYIKDCIQIRSRPRPAAMKTRSSSSVLLETPSSKKNAGDRAFSVVSPINGTVFLIPSVLPRTWTLSSQMSKLISIHSDFVFYDFLCLHSSPLLCFFVLAALYLFEKAG